MQTSTPLFIVANLQLAIDFYCGKMSFRSLGVHGEPPCFAMLSRDGAELMLSTDEGRGTPRPNGVDGVWDLYLVVEDVAAERQALRDGGVNIERGPSDMFYEMREIEVLDPDGHRICIAQDLSDTAASSKQSWEGTLEIDAKKLRLRLVLTATSNGLVGHLDSIDQNAYRMPIDAPTREGARLHFAMKAIDATFDGQFDADERTLRGTWSQRGHAWPLEFVRG